MTPTCQSPGSRPTQLRARRRPPGAHRPVGRRTPRRGRQRLSEALRAVLGAPMPGIPPQRAAGGNPHVEPGSIRGVKPDAVESLRRKVLRTCEGRQSAGAGLPYATRMTKPDQPQPSQANTGSWAPLASTKLRSAAGIGYPLRASSSAIAPGVVRMISSPQRRHGGYSIRTAPAPSTRATGCPRLARHRAPARRNRPAPGATQSSPGQRARPRLQRPPDRTRSARTLTGCPG